jgi:hypothetical protein
MRKKNVRVIYAKYVSLCMVVGTYSVLPCPFSLPLAVYHDVHRT